MKMKLLITLLGLFASQSSFAISAGQIDGFENESTMGWIKGFVLPVDDFFGPTNQASGGL